jgi:putative flippase GtrA
MDEHIINNISIAKYAMLFTYKFAKNTIFRYIIAGCISTCIDFLVYRILLISTEYINISKAVGLCTGITISYFINKIWTFEAKSTSIKELIYFIILYTISNITNIIVNRIILYNIGIDKEIYILFAFSISAVIAAAINYFGMKYIVFKKVK